MIRSAYENAGLDFSETGYFEAHGTGTAAGDPLETAAVGRVFASTRKPGDPLYIGSIKTNIGHLEGGAGFAGLIKALYILENGQIPPNLWLEKVNPKIDLEAWKLAIATSLTAWPTSGLRRISINSFGYGGTNAHCILDDAHNYLTSRGLIGRHNTALSPPTISESSGSDTNSVLDTPSSVSTPTSDEGTKLSHSSVSSALSDVIRQDTPRLFVWSSHEQNGINRMATSLASYLSEQGSKKDPILLKRLAYTLSNRRSRLSWTSFVVANSINTAIGALSSPARPLRPASKAPSALFIFTGQGAQWAGMGLELLVYTTFRQRIDEANSHLKSLGCEWDLIEELKGPRVNEPQVSQPACTAVQIALVDLLADWGVKPAITVGHSSGEIAAAYAKGALSRTAAWSIAYHRGRLSAGLKADGKELGMLAVALGEQETQVYIDQVKADPKPVVACINSPVSVTVSGSAEALQEVQDLIGSTAMNRRLVVKTAYHSPFMQELASAYLESLDGIESQSGDYGYSAKMFSSVTMNEITDAALRQPQYWVDNMVCPVKFRQALDAALAYANSEAISLVLVECGPHAALKGPIQQIVTAHPTAKDAKLEYTNLLTRKQNAITTALTAVGTLLQHGLPIKVAVANSTTSVPEELNHLVDLPPFAWNHNTRFWYETPRTRAYRLRADPRHDLLGTLDESCPDTTGEPVWKNYLRLAEVPWLKHNLLQGQAVLSFSGMLSLILEGTRRTADPLKTIVGYQFRDVFPGPPLVLDEIEESSVETRLTMRAWRSGSRSLTTYWREFSLSSRNRTGAWTQHSTGLVQIQYAALHADAKELYKQQWECITAEDSQERSVEAFYETVSTHLYTGLGENSFLKHELTERPQFSNLGMQWSEAYQTLRTVKISSSRKTVVGSMKIQDTAAFMPERFESKHVVHPTTLDGAFQLLAACDGGSSEQIGVPKYIESIYVNAAVSALAPGTILDAFGKIKEKWADGTNSTIVVLDSSSEPLLVFDGFKTVALETDAGTDAPSAEATTKALTKLGAFPAWGLDVQNSPVEAVKSVLRNVWSQALNADYNSIQDLEWASYILCKRAIAKFSAEDAEKMAKHHQVFYRYMARQVALSQSPETTLPCQTADWLSADEETENAVLSRAATTSLEGKMLVRILDNLDITLKGEIEAWELMNGDGLLEDMYRSGLSDEKTPAVQCEFISLLSHKRPLRILEVGAGTGSATSKILKKLGKANVDKYTYTDISASFFQQATEEFKDWSSTGVMDFKVFNAEHDPAGQGIDIGSYDVVVAFQVLHATSKMDETIANCRKLLRPNGHLIATELTSKVSRRSAVFGVLAGWWLGEDDGRMNGPEMLEEEWDLRLKRNGFNGVEWSFRDREDEGWSSSVMASRAIAEVDEESTTPSKAIIVLSEPADSLAPELSQELANAGFTVQQKSLAEIGNIEPEELSGTKCVFAVELNDTLFSRISAEEFEAVKRTILTAHSTVWLTRGGASLDCKNPSLSMFTGLARSIRGEVPGVKLMTIDLDPESSSSASVSDILRSVKLQDQESNNEHEFVERNGGLFISRIMPDERLSKILSSAVQDSQVAVDEEKPTPQPLKQNGRPLLMELKKTGDLESFVFRDDTEFLADAALGEDDVEIEVKALGLDPYDMAIAVGQIWDTLVGVECSGVVTRVGAAVTNVGVGDRVATFGISPHWYHTYFRSRSGAVHKLNDGMTFEDGAGIMRSYGAARYALIDVARLESEEKVLVHDATTAIGMAAVNIAQHTGAELFTTVSSEAEKKTLVDGYGVQQDHIFTFTEFAQGIKTATAQLGVDVVINGSVTGEVLRQTWHCVAPFGRFVELGMKDISKLK